MTDSRPLGVSLIAILTGLSGLILIVVGALGTVVVAGLLCPSNGCGSLGGLFSAIGIFVIVIGLVDFLVAYGLWIGNKIAYFLALIFAFFGLIAYGIGGSIIPFAIDLIIFVYLIVSKDARDYFD